MTAAPSTALDAIREAIAIGSERDASAYAIDEVTPAAAFQPVTRDDLATVLRLASEQGLAVVPQGSRTALAVGRPLEAYDIAVDLGGLRNTVEYVPDDLTVTVEAGRRLGALQAELGEHGQYLPIDAPPSDQVTIGGLLATARTSAWRGHVPAARDLILGIEAVLPGGERVKSGGRVVKNVTGYDLHRLHTGALGAFGVIVEASFKVAPLPEATRTLVGTTTTMESACAVALRLWDASPALRALTILDARAAARFGLTAAPTVLLELAGTRSTVDGSATALAASAQLQEGPDAIWGALRRAHGDTGDGAGAGGTAVLRAGVPSTAVGSILDAAERAGAVAWAHVASGAVLVTFDEPPALATVTELRAAAERAGGFLVVESGPASLRLDVPPQAGDAILVEALRDRFDPGRTINRGRWGATL